MQSQQKDFTFYIIIFLSLVIALSPAFLSHNYLRQDDLMWEIWPWMKISDFGYLYYNTVFQLVRPICMISFYTTDLISLNLHHAVYVRLICVILTSILGILLYRWQLLFNRNRILAATFAIASFTLPAYQIFNATANYSLIMTALLLTFGGLFCWHHSFTLPREKSKNRYLILGCLLFYASLLNYPLSSMYGWTLLTICYLNTFLSKAPELSLKRKFFYSASFLIILMMLIYFTTIILVHFLFNVDLQIGNRPGTLETAHLFSRFQWIFDILLMHSSLWLWGTSHFQPPLSLITICSIFAIALIHVCFLNRTKNIKAISIDIIKSFGIVFLLFFLAYSPVLATSERSYTFRYTLATMPILLYVFFWSIHKLSDSPHSKYSFLNIPKMLSSLIFITIAVFGVCYANLMMSDGIVGPHENDFNYVQQQLRDHVIPLLKQNKKVIIHAIDCDSGKNYSYSKNIPIANEYGMRTCQFQQQVIGVIIHSLYMMGYPSNYNRHNTVIYGNNEMEVKDTPWGNLIVNSDEHSLPVSDKKQTGSMPVVTIDMRKIPSYNRFDFYKGLLNRRLNQCEK